MNDWQSVTPRELTEAVISKSRAYDPRIETPMPEIGDVVFIRSVSPLARKTKAKSQTYETAVDGERETASSPMVRQA